MSKVEIYCDGSCLGNPGPGGYAAILKTHVGDKLKTKTVKGHEKDTTNNRMELKAAIMGLRSLSKPCQVTMYVDSQYVVMGMTKWMKNWQKNAFHNSAGKPIKNMDLWQELVHETAKQEVKFVWVKAHSGIEYNEKADQAALSQAKLASHS